jgi:hypothetical protein
MEGQVPTAPLSGLLRFYSRDELKRFLASLVERYRAEVQEYAERLGSLFRDDAQAKQGKGEVQRQASKGWVRLGPIMINATDPEKARAEVLLQAMEEAKLRLARAQDALRALEDPQLQALPERASYLLYLRQGAPERIVVDAKEGPPPPFSYTAYFRLVEQ